MKNLKITVFILMGLAFAQFSYAQSGFGVRGGFVSSDQKATVLSIVDANLKSKIGLDLAVLYNLDLGDGLSFQPELHYTQMGSKIDAGILDIRGEFDYIRIPLLLKYDVLKSNENIKVSPFAGPYISFLVNEDVDFLSLVFEDLSMKTLDFGADFGVMVNLSNGLFFDVRYMLGFSDIADAKLAGINVGELKNSGIGVGVGYMF